MCLKTVYTEKAPEPIGSFSQAIIYNNLVFTSGQLPLDPTSGRIVHGGIKEQTRTVLENIRAILKAAGSSLDLALKVTVYLKSLEYFTEFNNVYSEYFKEHKPARSVIEVSNIPKDALLEVDVIAAVKHK